MEKHRPEEDLFKNILENHPDFEASKSDIDNMRNRLDRAHNSNRKNGYGFWWLPLLVLPFIFVTAFLFYQNQKLDHQVQELNSILLTIQKDTIQHNNITYHFDTIYNTTYIDQVVERKSTRNYQNNTSSVLNYLSDNSRAFVSQTPSDYFKFKNNDLKQQPFIYSSSNTFTSLQLYNFAQEKLQSENRENSSKDRFGSSIIASQNTPFISPLFSFLENTIYENVLLENIDPAFEAKKSQKNPIRHFTPKGIQIGISGSPYSLTKIRPEVFRPAFSYGIESEIDFNKNVKLLLGFRKMDMTFEEKDPIFTAIYPSIMPNDPTDQLRELYVSLNQIQVPISLKYLFSNDKKWHPFFSLGIVAIRPLQQKFNYKLINTSLEEYNIVKKISEGVVSIKNFQGAFGVETNLSSKLSASAEVYYLHDFELGAGEYFLFRNAGLNIGLKYKL